METGFSLNNRPKRTENTPGWQRAPNDLPYLGLFRKKYVIFIKLHHVRKAKRKQIDHIKILFTAYQSESTRF